MNSSEHESTKCPYCSSASSATRYTFDEHRIKRCGDCGLMWLYPMPTMTDLKEVYDEDYFTNEKLLDSQGNNIYGYVDYISERINKQYGYKKIVETVRGHLNIPDGQRRDHGFKWFDIGCGLAHLIEVAFDEGFDVTGMEFNSYAVQYIRSKYTFKLIEGTLNDIQQNETFEVISMLDVIEHLLNPFDDLKKIRELIADNGILVISTMDSDSLVSKILGKRLEDFRRIKEHLYFFSRDSLSRVLHDLGWDVLKIESTGHTFELKMLFDRIEMITPFIGKFLKAIIFPRWLLYSNIYVNPRTKMTVYCRPRK